MEKPDAWPYQPLIYEIPAWPWLAGLAQSAGRPLTLGEIPGEVLSRTANEFDAIWLMGVWQRSPQARRLALELKELQAAYRLALPDWTPADVAGSPYAVHAYQVDDFFGGHEGLKAFREQLAKMGKKLILDYVPNHVALDHPWTEGAEPLFISGTETDLRQAPGDWVARGSRILAHGRDPYFTPWTDTVQINAFSGEARKKTIETLLSMASLCDGVRCDMAMLLLTDVFRQTWQEKAGPALAVEFWEEVISAVKARFPSFVFVAEAYWDKEWDLMQLGFDYCYDKRLYDRLVHGDAESLRVHLLAHPNYQRRLLRFIENHDEPRAAEVMEEGREQAAAMLLTMLPGASLVYAGQREGRKIRIPVQLGRAPNETGNQPLEAWYGRLRTRRIPRARSAEDIWQLCDTQLLGSGGANPWIACHRVIEGEHWLGVINFCGHGAQGHVRVPEFHWGSGQWTFQDVWGGEAYTYAGRDLEAHGLYVALPAWQAHFFHVTRSAA